MKYRSHEGNKRRNMIACLVWLATAWVIATRGGGWFVSYLCVSLYYVLIVAGLIVTGGWQKLCTAGKRDKMLIVAASAALICFTWFVIARERFVYFWDYSSYMYYTVNLSGSLGGSIVDGMLQLFRSINHDEYNFLVCYIIAIPLKICGQSYLAFELLIVLMFLIPANLCIAGLTAQVTERMGLSNIGVGPGYFMCAVFPPFLYVVLLGYVDAVGLPLMALCYLYALKLHDEKKLNVTVGIFMAGNMLALLLIRRYFAGFLLGLIVYIVIDFFANIFSSKDRIERQSIFIGYLKNYGIIAVLCLFVLVLGFSGLLWLMLFNNYKNTYVGYQRAAAENWYYWIRYFGAGVLVLTAAECILELKNIKKVKFLWGVAAIPGTLLCAAYMFTLAGLSEHVYYLFTIPLCVCAILFVAHMYTIAANKEKHAKWIGPKTIVILSAGVCMINFLVMNQVIDISNERIGVFTGNRYHSRVRGDMDALNEMQDYLAEKAAAMNNGKVYVAASGGVLNDDVLRRLRAPDYNVPYPLLSTTHADLVAGFNTDFFDAAVVVVTDPIQLHLQPGTQQVQEFIVNGILNEEGVFHGKYQLDKSFALDSGITAYAYVRTGTWMNQDEEEVAAHFDQIYPDYPELFGDRFERYLERVFPRAIQTNHIDFESGKLYSSYTKSGDKLISTQPGTLIYGPYELVAKGTYDIKFHYRYLGELSSGEQIGTIDVGTFLSDKVNFDHRVVAVYAGETIAEITGWEVQSDMDSVETRFFAEVPNIEFIELEITKTE